VGRLDLTTEGLLLLTNDGALARYLELPSTGWSRRYRVRVHGKVNPDALKALAGGVTVSGIHYGPITARLDRQQGSNAWLTFVIREGKNREVRRVCEHLGLTVNRLIRVGYGPFELGDLEPGAVAKVPARILRDQLGGALPDLDFDGADTTGPRAGKDAPAARSKPGAKRGSGGKPDAGGGPRATGKPGERGVKRPYRGKPGADETAPRSGDGPRRAEAKRTGGPKRTPAKPEWSEGEARAPAAKRGDAARRPDAGPGRSGPPRGKAPGGKRPFRDKPGADEAPERRADTPRHAQAKRGTDPRGPGAKRDGGAKPEDARPARSGPPRGKGPGKPKRTGPAKGPGGPKAPDARQPSGERDATRASTGRSRGSARRRRTLDANRRRPS
jgi:23S rRNA pseudouridine2605 synthase